MRTVAGMQVSLLVRGVGAMRTAVVDKVSLRQIGAVAHGAAQYTGNAAGCDDWRCSLDPRRDNPPVANRSSRA